MIEEKVKHSVIYLEDEAKVLGLKEGEENQEIEYTVKELSDKIIRYSDLIEPKTMDKLLEESNSKKLDPEPLEGELFRDYPPIPQFKVSNKGRIKIDNKIIEQHQEKPGYLYATNKEKYVYRLVAKTWLERPAGETKGLEVHHIDNNGFNNTVENLLWVTKKFHVKIYQNYRNKYKYK
ncbi:hypothetical protein FACS189421_11840 [Bacteroidia bacterium]|nr:hypothetical protein FACS189421_11840 [Bacteroidia bacterium]GHT05814.1 hypothetical protein FACS189423_10390 [Bacteroidia bacterium]GHT49995.1 hypothetical protein FACS189440_16650 [Bacteroidia bacterium]